VFWFCLESIHVPFRGWRCAVYGACATCWLPLARDVIALTGQHFCGPPFPTVCWIVHFCDIINEVSNNCFVYCLVSISSARGLYSAVGQPVDPREAGCDEFKVRAHTCCSYRNVPFHLAASRPVRAHDLWRNGLLIAWRPCIKSTGHWVEKEAVVMYQKLIVPHARGMSNPRELSSGEASGRQICGKFP
jgi:hypothetical protein